MSVWLWDEEQERDIKSKLNKIGLKRSGAKYCDGSRLKNNFSNNKHASKFYNSTGIFTCTNKKFGEMLANLFGTSEEGIHVQAFYNQISNLDLWNSENMKLFLGFYEGEVVTVGSLICSKDSIGIYDIATKEEMRGRGFGYYV